MNKKVRSKKPSVFIGSSSEGKLVAEYLQMALDDHCDSTIWDQGIFGLSQETLDSLIKATSQFDFAVLVVTADDMVTKRGRRQHAPRDNVILEIGLFLGALGRERTFIVYCRNHEIQLPSDLAGVTVATYEDRGETGLRAAINPVSVRIREAIRAVNAGLVSGDDPDRYYNFLLKIIRHCPDSILLPDITHFFKDRMINSNQYTKLGNEYQSAKLKKK